MKLYWITLIFLVVCIAKDISAEKTRRHKRIRKPHADPATLSKPKQDTEISSNSIEKKTEKPEDVELPPEVENNMPIMDPCLKVHCGAGRICQLDDGGEPQCVCIPTCPEESDARRKVCSNHNETWSSDCAVYQQRCLCQTGKAECKGPNYKHVHIEYYGECRNMPECTKEEMVDFPRRMRDWLFNIMRDLADRDELTSHYLKMEREAESNMTRRWTNAAIWKFCELDGNPPDRSVSLHELFPIRAPLMALEHCIAPFLKACDTDDNHRITLKEWAKCLELDEDEIEDRCEQITDE
ncbi:SPARC [Coccinella septempunctata]|uniref:SPARC n=1 Tax=Coccinella septempunctata TaxID=41139 RepID=UPI001D0660D3|nr:SPARC [Coccinella septempunctata]XP_044762182.1 SPARC [Coccinella septempunctata]